MDHWRGWDMLGSLKCSKIAKTNPICLGSLPFCFPGHLEVLGIDIFEQPPSENWPPIDRYSNRHHIGVVRPNNDCPFRDSWDYHSVFFSQKRWPDWNECNSWHFFEGSCCPISATYVWFIALQDPNASPFSPDGWSANSLGKSMGFRHLFVCLSCRVNTIFNV